MSFLRRFAASCRVPLLASLAVCFALVPAPRADGADRAAVLRAAREVAQSARYATLITLGEDGQPQARIVDPLGPDENFVVWIGTNPSTRKVAEVAKDSRVTISFFHPAGPAYVTLVGNARLVTDPAVKAKHWKSAWAPFYKSEHRGADFALLAFVPRRMEIVDEVHGLINDPKNWRPVTVDFPREARAVKTIGMLGGMSWQSTHAYYRLLNEDVAARLGGYHSARLVLSSVDFHGIESAMSKGAIVDATRG